MDGVQYFNGVEQPWAIEILAWLHYSIHLHYGSARICSQVHFCWHPRQSFSGKDKEYVNTINTPLKTCQINKRTTQVKPIRKQTNNYKQRTMVFGLSLFHVRGWDWCLALKLTQLKQLCLDFCCFSLDGWWDFGPRSWVANCFLLFPTVSHWFLLLLASLSTVSYCFLLVFLLLPTVALLNWRKKQRRNCDIPQQKSFFQLRCFVPLIVITTDCILLL